MKIGDNYPIPANTYVIVHQSCILMDEKNWINADNFNPDRFLDKHGKCNIVKTVAFIPFGTGRRICPGEQLAINDLFLILVRFIQLTSDYEIKLLNETYEVLEPDPAVLLEQSPKNFVIKLLQKQV